MAERFVDAAPELNCQPESQHVATEAADHEVALAHHVEKIVATNAETGDISHEIVVAEDVAGNFHLL